MQTQFTTCACGCGTLIPARRVRGKPRFFANGHRPHYYSPEVRFWAKVNKTDGCWLWTGGTNGVGYGILSRGGRMSRPRFFYAHRFSYELHKGSIPEGLVLDHLCRNPSCVNPEHLEPVTEAENLRRGNGVSATNAKKTECPQGHAYTAENIYWHRGGRHCKACHKNRMTASRQR